MTTSKQQDLLTASQVGALIESDRRELEQLVVCGYFPAPTHAKPARWPASAVDAYMHTPTPRYCGRPIPPRVAK